MTKYQEGWGKYKVQPRHGLEAPLSFVSQWTQSSCLPQSQGFSLSPTTGVGNQDLRFTEMGVGIIIIFYLCINCCDLYQSTANLIVNINVLVIYCKTLIIGDLKLPI